MDIEVFESISKFAKDIWPLIVTSCAMLAGLTVFVLNLYRIKKTKLEIEKLEREKGYEPPSIKISTKDEVGKYRKLRALTVIEWPK